MTKLSKCVNGGKVQLSMISTYLRGMIQTEPHDLVNNRCDCVSDRTNMNIVLF